MLTLFPHQESIKEYLISNRGGAIFAKPRTGKTLPTKRAVEEMGALPCVIVCPSPVMVSWYGALIEDGVSEDRIRVYNNPKMSKIDCKDINLDDADWFIINYEKVIDTKILTSRDNLSRLIELPRWKAIILDESYKLANIDTSSIGKYLTDKYPYDEEQVRIVMTGTPVSESALDVIGQYKFINGSFMGYENLYAYRNANYNKWGYEWVYRNRLHKRRVERFVKENSFQINLEDLGLGGVILKGVDVLEMNQEQIDLCYWVSKTKLYPLKDDDFGEMTPAIRAMFFHKIASGVNPITNELINNSKAEHIRDVALSTGSKILVLTRFTKIIPHIMSCFHKAKIKCDYIDGSVSKQDRDTIRCRFQDGDLQIVVAQVDTVARGLDFSSLDRIYNHTNSFSCEVKTQSELRGQNVKRKSPYEVIDLCYRDSIDVDIHKVHKKKNANVQKFIKEITEHQRMLWSTH